MVERCARVRVRPRERDMSTASKTKRIKLVFGIAIPVLVLVTTIVMVSMSFAWFSQETTASIQSINLATQKAFVLEFGSSSATNDNLPYMGQTALDVKNGNHGWLYDVANPQANENDAPYYFVSQLTISTQGEAKDIELKLQNITISKGGTTLDRYSDTDGGGDARLNSDIALNFTWFFVQHSDGNNAVNWSSASQTGSEGLRPDDAIMKAIQAKARDVWYTPYGKFEFAGDESSESPNIKLTKINEENVPTDSAAIIKLLQKPQAITGFRAEENATFDFYIIFAPEIIFWSQFFGNDNKISAKSSEGGSPIYKDDDLKKMLGRYCNIGTDGVVDREKCSYQMYYSDEKYMESTFSFGASLTVVGDDTAQETTP